MKKVVEKTHRVAVTLCDLCEADIGNSRRCWFCNREICYKCGEHKFFGRSGDLVEMAMHVCNECLKHGELIEKIQAVLDGANQKLREWTDLLRAAVKRTP